MKRFGKFYLLSHHIAATVLLPLYAIFLSVKVMLLSPKFSEKSAVNQTT
jgi:hypothetical protein